MNVYNYDPDSKIFTGISKANESPLEPGVYGIPLWATDVAPPEVPSNSFVWWNESNWVIEAIPPTPSPTPPAPTPTPTPLPLPITWEDIRIQRNGLLFTSDWTQFTDVNLSNKQEWATYRQALRDIPQNVGAPEDVAWPQQPV